MVYLNKRQMKNSIKRLNKSREEFSNALYNNNFSVANNIQAEYDMWSWIYQEIANIRIRVNQLGTLVRINNEMSPGYLEAYHSEIYSFLLPISVVVNDNTWNEIENLWLAVKNEIKDFLKKRKNIHNLKIPFKLIRDLDRLYRIALLVAQKGGLGFKITVNSDFEQSIEKMITGE